jgi:hypothetical protein
VLHRIGAEAARIFGAESRPDLPDGEPDAAIAFGLGAGERPGFLCACMPAEHQGENREIQKSFHGVFYLLSYRKIIRFGRNFLSKES